MLKKAALTLIVTALSTAGFAHADQAGAVPNSRLPLAESLSVRPVASLELQSARVTQALYKRAAPASALLPTPAPLPDAVWSDGLLHLIFRKARSA